MKKTLIALAALAMVAACNKAEVVESTQDNLIGFNAPFVDNATKALGDKDYSGNKALTGFKVYGTVTGNSATVNLFSDTQINRNSKDFGVAWDYADETKKQYWLPSCSYNFAAVVDGTVTTTDNYGMPTKLSYTVGEGDLLYATAAATTDASSTPSGTGINTNGCVAFTFEHLLSKVYFSFTNGFNNDDYKYSVNEVTISGFKKDGTYTIGATTPWALGTDATDTPLSFGTLGTLAKSATTTSTVDHLIIPGSQEITISFTYDVIFKDQTISQIPVTKTITQNFAQKTVYKIDVTLPALGNEIKFTVTGEPGNFTTGNDITIQ